MKRIDVKQKHQQRLIYEKKLKNTIEKNKIPEDEIDPLVASLITVVNDLEISLGGGNPDTDLVQDNEDFYRPTERPWEFGEYSCSETHSAYNVSHCCALR